MYGTFREFSGIHYQVEQCTQISRHRFRSNGVKSIWLGIWRLYGIILCYGPLNLMCRYYRLSTGVLIDRLVPSIYADWIIFLFQYICMVSVTAVYMYMPLDWSTEVCIHWQWKYASTSKFLLQMERWRYSKSGLCERWEHCGIIIIQCQRSNMHAQIATSSVYWPLHVFNMTRNAFAGNALKL